MLQKVIRIFGIGLSVMLLVASGGIIFWISQDEQERLALKERVSLMGDADPSGEIEKKSKADAAAELETADRTLHEIDTLLAALSSDDLPSEE